MLTRFLWMDWLFYFKWFDGLILLGFAFLVFFKHHWKAFWVFSGFPNKQMQVIGFMVPVSFVYVLSVLFFLLDWGYFSSDWKARRLVYIVGCVLSVCLGFPKDVLKSFRPRAFLKPFSLRFLCYRRFCQWFLPDRRSFVVPRGGHRSHPSSHRSFAKQEEGGAWVVRDKEGRFDALFFPFCLYNEVLVLFRPAVFTCFYHSPTEPRTPTGSHPNNIQNVVSMTGKGLCHSKTCGFWKKSGRP